MPLARPAALIFACALWGGAALAAVAPDRDTLAAQAYVQGRLALADDDLAAAAERFGVALEASGDDMLRRRALEVAILGGDMKAAVRLANRIALAPEGPAQAGLADSLVALTRAVGAAAAKDWRAYDAARTAFSAPGRNPESGQLLATLLNGYGMAGRGDVAGALALLDSSTEKGLSASYIAEHRAHLLAIGRRWPEAADAYGRIVAAEGANVARLRIAAAAAALEAGASDPAWRTRAITTLGGGPERDPMLMEARARLAADPRLEGRKLGALPTRAQEGLALLLLRVSADLARERAVGPAVNFARLATFLEPGIADGWFILSDTLLRSERPELALQALDSVAPGPATTPMADSRRAAILAQQGAFDEARAIARRLAERADAGVEDWLRLADIERRSGRNAEAAASYGRGLALLPGVPGPMHAQLWFLRGSANEVAGNWPAAEADLRRAVELQPDNAVFLNYLGYSLLDRRRGMAEARELIARAFKAAPENGAIIDSMGWAEFAAGNYPEAVRLLEKARAAEPADPTVADHLGDALWKAGRRIEARHAWASAATLSPEPKLAERIAKKLEFGLDVALAER